MAHVGHTEEITMRATLRNRYTSKTTTVKVKKTDRGLLYIEARQYNDALSRLGHGPIATDTPIMVFTANGRPTQYLD
jgi:hypothetical protein